MGNALPRTLDMKANDTDSYLYQQVTRSTIHLGAQQKIRQPDSLACYAAYRLAAITDQDVLLATELTESVMSYLHIPSSSKSPKK
jgi:hypothetical protein